MTVVSLQHWDGTNGGTDATDEFPGINWEYGNGATLTNTWTMFGSPTSAAADGTQHYLRTFNLPNLVGDFGIECFISGASGSGARVLFDCLSQSDDVSSNAFQVYTDPSGTGVLRIYSGGAVVIQGTINVRDSADHYVALVRVSGQIQMWIDGVQDGGNWANAADIVMGDNGFAWGGATYNGFTSGSWEGYIDECRIQSGAAPDPSVIPSAPFPNPAQDPIITQHPESITVDEGQPAVFNVVATGTGVLHYQWYDDAAPVGTDQDSYTIGATVIGDDGSQIYVDVTDDIGTTSSNIATLTVYQPVIYPPEYPCPTWDFGQETTSFARRTPFDCGWTRSRRQWDEFGTAIDLSWIMDTTTFATWSDWMEQNGYNWFEIELDRFGGSKVVHTVRLAGPIYYSYDNFDKVNVRVRTEEKDD